MSERVSLMRFPDRRHGAPMRVVGKYTEIVDDREVVKTIRIYTSQRKALRT